MYYFGLIFQMEKRKQDMRWCQGKPQICTRRQKPEVQVRWDAIPELTNEQTISIVIFPESKQKRNMYGAWIINFTFLDDYSEDESNM